MHYYYTDTLSISDLYHVNVNLVGVASLWREFGLAVKLNPLTLERIKSTYQQLSEHCFTEVLAVWLSGEDKPRNPSAPNWEEAIAALKSPSVNRADHARQLLRKLRSEIATYA